MFIVQNLKKKQIKTKIGVIIWVPVLFALVFHTKTELFWSFRIFQTCDLILSVFIVIPFDSITKS
jgi:hypothetical protein